jgi:hypothetical protein
VPQIWQAEATLFYGNVINVDRSKEASQGVEHLCPVDPRSARLPLPVFQRVAFVEDVMPALRPDSAHVVFAAHLAPLPVSRQLLETQRGKKLRDLNRFADRPGQYADFTVGLLAFAGGYRELFNVCSKGRGQRTDVRQIPVPLSWLCELETGKDILLWMLFHAHVEHFRVIPKADGGTELQPANSLHISPNSLFSLTEDGAAFAAGFLGDGPCPNESPVLSTAWDRFLREDLVPHYDADGRTFRWGAHTLKHFRQPATNQELILLTAEELNWPAWFDDPLPKRSRKSTKERLHDTIKDLNRRQRPHLFHFKGDGTGTRVGWEYR